jgi:hypothetical protein
MTYRAFWQDDHSKLIFKRKRKEQVRDLLPQGTTVFVHEDNTLGRVDGGDEYEFAMFICNGRRIMVIPDP